MKQWEDCKREDLNKIPEMLKIRFKPVFSYNDKRFCRIVPENPPADGVSFENMDLHKHVWKTYKNDTYGWTIADNINGYFLNHKTFESLDEIISMYK
jgi:hypothetical protein